MVLTAHLHPPFFMSMEQTRSTENHWCVAKCVAVLPSSADPQRRNANVTTIENRNTGFLIYVSPQVHCWGSEISSQEMLYACRSSNVRVLAASEETPESWVSCCTNGKGCFVWLVWYCCLGFFCLAGFVFCFPLLGLNKTDKGFSNVSIFFKENTDIWPDFTCGDHRGIFSLARDSYFILFPKPISTR